MYITCNGTIGARQQQEPQKQTPKRNRTGKTTTRGEAATETSKLQTEPTNAAITATQISRQYCTPSRQASKQSDGQTRLNKCKDKKVITWLAIPLPPGKNAWGTSRAPWDACRRTYEVTTNQGCTCTCRMAGQRGIGHRLCAVAPNAPNTPITQIH